MGISIREVADDEVRVYLDTLEIAAGRHPNPANVDDGVANAPECSRLAAYEGGRIIGGTAFDRLELTLPGRSMSTVARIMLTAILPTHRGKGIALELMRRQLLDVHAAGLPLAIFTTSGPGIYDQIGYNPATAAMTVRFDTGRVRCRAPAPVSVTLIGREEAVGVLPDVFDAHRRLQPGQVSRGERFWAAWFRDRPLYRPPGGSERFFAIADAGSGYLTYRLVPGPLREQPVSEMLVEDLVAVDDDARLALWEFCLAFRQAPLVSALNVPTDEPLTWATEDVRSVKVVGRRDFLWLRLADARQALCLRAYDAAAELVFELYDPVLPNNAGTFRLRVGDGPPSWEPATVAPDISLDVTALAAAFLGATTFTTLARAHRLSARSADALRRADLAFSSSPAPWTVTDW